MTVAPIDTCLELYMSFCVPSKMSWKDQYPHKDSLWATQERFTLVLFFGITLVAGFMVVRVFTDMELYVFSVPLLFVVEVSSSFHLVGNTSSLSHQGSVPKAVWVYFMLLACPEVC